MKTCKNCSWMLDEDTIIEDEHGIDCCIIPYCGKTDKEIEDINEENECDMYEEW